FAPAIFGFAIARLARLAALAGAEPPILHLRGHPADTAAGPDQFEREEQPPRVVAFIDGARNDVAGHRGRVDPMAAEPAHQPYMRRKFPKLRHAVKSQSEHAGPDMFDFDRPKLRKYAFDVTLEPACKYLWIAFPGGEAAGPYEPITADDPVVVVGEIGI